MAAMFDLVADEYDQHVPFFTAYARRFVPWLDVRPGDRFLDIGIGRGAVARVAEEAGAQVVGVDVSLAMLAKTPYPAALMDAQRLAVRTGVVDIAAGAFSIHLCEDPQAAAAEAARVLRPGGTFGVVFGGRTSTPQWSFYNEILKRYAVHSHGEPRMPPLVPFGDPHEVLGAAGLVDIEVGDCEIHVPVADGETFLRGELAHGYRSLFDAVATDRRPEMEAEMLEHLRRMEASGGIVLDRVAVFAKGTKSRRIALARKRTRPVYPQTTLIEAGRPVT